LGSLAAVAGARAVPNVSPNRYQTIPERNVFNLKKQEVVVQEPPPVQVPKITLTGITTLLGLKRAVLQVAPTGRPGEATRDEAFILAEGQREGDLEVLEINEAAGTVKVRTAGTLLTLDFVNNGTKPPTLPAPATSTQTVATPNVPQPGH